MCFFWCSFAWLLYSLYCSRHNFTHFLLFNTTLDWCVFEEFISRTHQALRFRFHWAWIWLSIGAKCSVCTVTDSNYNRFLLLVMMTLLEVQDVGLLVGFYFSWSHRSGKFVTENCSFQLALTTGSNLGQGNPQVPSPMDIPAPPTVHKVMALMSASVLRWAWLAASQQVRPLAFGFHFCKSQPGAAESSASSGRNETSSQLSYARAIAVLS